MDEYHVLKSIIDPNKAKEIAEWLWSASEDDLNNPRPNFKFYGINHTDPNAVYPYSEYISDVLVVSKDFFQNNYKMDHTFELKRVFGNIMKTGAEVNSHDDDGDIYAGKPDIEKHYSGLLFFNDDYEGGELYFENLGVELKPEPGDLVLFRGDARRLHGVKKVTSGYRANLIIFFRDFLPNDVENPPRRFRDIGNAE
jgi:hypothetical protein